MVSLTRKCNVPFGRPRQQKCRSFARRLVILFSVGRQIALRIAYLLALMFAATFVPLFASDPTIKLIPQITTLAGTGTSSVPKSSLALASNSQDEGPAGITTDAAGNIYFGELYA
jgi:hypothetical protein